MIKTALREERKRLIAQAQTIIIKVGSAELASDSGLNRELINSLASQIAQIRALFPPREKEGTRKIVVVSSGAVAAGRSALLSINKASFSNPKKARHGLASIGQGLLMHAWHNAFAPHNILTGQVLLTREDLRARTRFHFASDTFSEMLQWGVIPIVNENDTVSVMGLNFGDNDYLASLLVNLVGANLFVNLTSSSAVMNGKPDSGVSVEPIRYLEDIRHLDIESLCGAATKSGSGGMQSKLLAARRVSQLGVPTLILPGKQPGILLQAFQDACGTADDSSIDLGTWICPSEKTVSRRKFWLAYQSPPAGVVEIDAGAARALLREGRSLLPGGIINVKGNFDSGELLLITHEGKNLGVGFSNYSSVDLSQIRNLKRHEVAAILGKARYPDVIHRDNLLLDAAIGIES